MRDLINDCFLFKKKEKKNKCVRVCVCINFEILRGMKLIIIKSKNFTVNF